MSKRRRSNIRNPEEQNYVYRVTPGRESHHVILIKTPCFVSIHTKEVQSNNNKGY